MPYYTNFTIAARNYPPSNSSNAVITDELAEKIKRELEEISGYDFYGSFTEGELYTGDSISWYACDQDMHELSCRYPGVLFTVYGDGEESGDLWYTYLLNGQVQHDPVRLEFDGFQHHKLRPWVAPSRYLSF